MQKDTGKNASEDAGTDLLDGAYALKTPEDNRAYYQRFAANYDRDFAAGLGYIYPKAVADAFLDLTGLPNGPVCDIGLSLIHISEPTRRRGISYAVFCLKKKN